MLQTFLPLFFMTFGICLFIVLMQFLWRNIDDLVGKGLGLAVMGEMFFYAALFLVPMALPLAILLASLMTFGNLGEKFELLAMKSAGVSLFHIMRPLIVTVAMISIGAFFFQNNAMPIIQVKLYTLLYSIKQKSPELDIREGVFNSQIKGFNVYVKHKNPETGRLYDVIIYDHSDGFDNARVITSDSAQMKISADKLFLVLDLFQGESFENLNTNQKRSAKTKSVPYRRESFTTKQVLIAFDGNFNRTDDSFLKGRFVGKDIQHLQAYIDSAGVVVDSIKNVQGQHILKSSYRKDLEEKKELKNKIKKVHLEDLSTMNFYDIYNSLKPSQQRSLLQTARNSTESIKSDYYFKAANLSSQAYEVRRHKTEWHKKFTISFACLVFFFIGAPLGAIIRKGGLGTPVVLSVLLFIFYYIIDNTGFKMARDGIWSAWQGMWLSSFVLAPLGIFLTYKAVTDSVVMNLDTYVEAIKNVFGKKGARTFAGQEVSVRTPDYKADQEQICFLIETSKMYLKKHKRWPNYIQFWRHGGREEHIIALSKKLEEIIEDLSYSDQPLILNKLMDYPKLEGYNPLKIKMSTKIGLALGLFIPIGLSIYLIAVYQRKLLRSDLLAVQRASEDMKEILDNE